LILKTHLKATQMEAQKAEMVKIALEKLKEANIKKVFWPNFNVTPFFFSVLLTYLQMCIEAHRKSVHGRWLRQNCNHR